MGSPQIHSLHANDSDWFQLCFVPGEFSQEIFWQNGQVIPWLLSRQLWGVKLTLSLSFMKVMEVCCLRGNCHDMSWRGSDDNSGVNRGSRLVYTSSAFSTKFLRVFNKLVATNVSQMNYSIGDTDFWHIMTFLRNQRHKLWQLHRSQSNHDRCHPSIYHRYELTRHDIPKATPLHTTVKNHFVSQHPHNHQVLDLLRRDVLSWQEKRVQIATLQWNWLL